MSRERDSVSELSALRRARGTRCKGAESAARIRDHRGEALRLFIDAMKIDLGDGEQEHSLGDIKIPALHAMHIVQRFLLCLRAPTDLPQPVHFVALLSARVRPAARSGPPAQHSRRSVRSPGRGTPENYGEGLIILKNP